MSLPNIDDHPIGLPHDEWHDGEIPLGYKMSKTLPDPYKILITPVLETESSPCSLPNKPRYHVPLETRHIPPFQKMTVTVKSISAWNFQAI
jgi:hypothetical protein